LKFPAYVANSGKPLHRIFVKDLLMKDPVKRLGRDGLHKKKPHEWLENFTG
jgi:hypothetical protein